MSRIGESHRFFEHSSTRRGLNTMEMHRILALGSLFFIPLACHNPSQNKNPPLLLIRRSPFPRLQNASTPNDPKALSNQPSPTLRMVGLSSMTATPPTPKMLENAPSVSTRSIACSISAMCIGLRMENTFCLPSPRTIGRKARATRYLLVDEWESSPDDAFRGPIAHLVVSRGDSFSSFLPRR